MGEALLPGERSAPELVGSTSTELVYRDCHGVAHRPVILAALAVDLI
jgi:hypothetical protein